MELDGPEPGAPTTINGLELAVRASRGARSDRSRGLGARRSRAPALTPRGGITKRGIQVRGRQRARGGTVAVVSEPEGQSHQEMAGDGPGEGLVA